jgi:hypothetical protein
MAKKKQETVVAPLSGKELFEKTLPTKAAVVSDLPAIKPATKTRTNKLSGTVLEHLHLLELYPDLSVADFRGYSSTGELAASTLLSLEAAGLVSSKWSKSRRIFNLTPAGKQKLDEGMPAA